MHADGNWIGVAARRCNVFPERFPSDSSGINAVANSTPFGIGVREETLLGHSPAVVPRDLAKPLGELERLSVVRPAQPIDLREAFILERLDARQLHAR